VIVVHIVNARVT